MKTVSINLVTYARVTNSAELTPVYNFAKEV